MFGVEFFGKDLNAGALRRDGASLICTVIAGVVGRCDAWAVDRAAPGHRPCRGGGRREGRKVGMATACERHNYTLNSESRRLSKLR